MTIVSIADLAWAAGFVDGEGCILLERCNIPKLTVSQMDPRPLVKLREMFAGHIKLDRSIARMRGSRPIWNWSVASQLCLSAIDQMIPFLVVKREQAEVLLTVRDLIRKRGRQVRVSPENRAAREAIYAELGRLKRAWPEYEAGANHAAGVSVTLPPNLQEALPL